MAEKVTFDGPNKLIHIKAGVTSINVAIDLYSKWKLWVKDEGGAIWDAAFTTTGGEPTNPDATQFTPQYFFLVAPWALECSTGLSVSIQTNLYPDDGDFNRMLVITNNSNIAIRLSDAPVVRSELEKALEYGGIVYINSNATETGSSYPYGTSAKPVNNALDAKLVGELYGISNYHLIGALYLAGAVTLDNFEIEGAVGARVWSNGEPTLTNGRVRSCILSGDIGTNATEMEFIDCSLADGILNISGQWFNSGFQGSFQIAPNVNILMIGCYSEIGGAGAPTLIMPDDVNSVNNIAFRGYMGGLLVQGFKGPNGRDGNGDPDPLNPATMVATISLDTGKVKLDSTNVGGAISVRGFPTTAFTDNSNGTYVDTNSLIASGPQLEEALQNITFDGKVIIDSVNGVDGTDYPIGTLGTPVKNIADAITIADARFIQIFDLHSDIVIDQDIENYRINGVNGGEVAYFAGVDVHGTYLYNLIIAGAIVSDGQIRCENCQIAPGTTGLSGAFKTCGIVGDITIVNPSVSAMIDCFTAKMSPLLSDPTIFMGATDDEYAGNWSFINFANGVKLANLNNADSFIDFNSTGGNIEILPSCTDGIIRITGVSENTVRDNSNGTTVLVDTLSASAVKLNEMLEVMDYDGQVVINIDNGFAGTAYPIGTLKYPSNNLPDAKVIAENRNLLGFELKSDITININGLPGAFVRGFTGNEIVTLTGTNLNYTRYENLVLTGNAGAQNRLRVDDCQIYNLDNFNGVMTRTAIIGNLTLAGGESSLLANCYTSAILNGNELIGGDTSGVHIYIGHEGDGLSCESDIRGMYGSVIFGNIDNEFKRISAHFSSGFVIIEPTCSDGILWLQGILMAGIVDLSTGTNINFSELQVRIDGGSKQVVRDAMALATEETPALESIDNIVDRIDKNTQE